MQWDGWRLAAQSSAPLSPFPWRQPSNERAVGAVRAVLLFPDQNTAQDCVHDGCTVLDVSISTGPLWGRGKPWLVFFFPKMLIILASFFMELIPIQILLKHQPHI